MSEAIRQPGGAALPRPMGIGEILSTAFQLYQRHWRTLLAIAAVVVVPFTLLQYLIGDQVRTRGRDHPQRGGGRDRNLVGRHRGAGGGPGRGGDVPGPDRGDHPGGGGRGSRGGSQPGAELPLRLPPVLVGPAGECAGRAGHHRRADPVHHPGHLHRGRLAVSIEALVVEGRRGTEAMGRSWELVGGHWWHAFGTLVVAGLLTGVVNALITAPFGNTSWFVQAVAAAVATVVTLPYGVLVGVLLYLDLRARKENLNLERLRSRPAGISHLTQGDPSRPKPRGAQASVSAAEGSSNPTKVPISEIWMHS